MPLTSIRNIYCVGRNYRLHAAELGNDVPESPMLFQKPTHALVAMDGGEVRLPADRGAIHYEAELVLHIGRAYEPGLSVDDIADRFALGIDFTLRDVQEGLKAKGHPWLPAKGFLGSAPLGEWRAFLGAETLTVTDFSLRKNGTEVQRGNVREMIFSLQTIVEYVGTHYGLDAGDVIYTGTPAGVGPVADGDRLTLYWGEDPVGECVCRLG